MAGFWGKTTLPTSQQSCRRSWGYLRKGPARRSCTTVQTRSTGQRREAACPSSSAGQGMPEVKRHAPHGVLCTPCKEMPKRGPPPGECRGRSRKDKNPGSPQKRPPAGEEGSRKTGNGTRLLRKQKETSLDPHFQARLGAAGMTGPSVPGWPLGLPGLAAGSWQLRAVELDHSCIVHLLPSWLLPHPLPCQFRLWGPHCPACSPWGQLGLLPVFVRVGSPAWEADSP